jgi:hypothetical protein
MDLRIQEVFLGNNNLWRLLLKRVNWLLLTNKLSDVQMLLKIKRKY